MSYSYFQDIDHSIAEQCRKLIIEINQYMKVKQSWDKSADKLKSGDGEFFSDILKILVEPAQTPLDSERQIKSIVDELEALQNNRRQIRSVYTDNILTWKPHQITAELRKRKRDLEELGDELNKWKRVDDISSYIAPLTYEQRFIQNIIYELEGLLGYVENLPPPRKTPSQIVSDKAQELMDLEKRKEELKQKSPESLHKDIDIMFGKLMDDVRRRD